MLQTPSVFNKRNPGNPAATDSLGRKRQLAEEETGRRRGHTGRRGVVYTFQLLFNTITRQVNVEAEYKRARTQYTSSYLQQASAWAAGKWVSGQVRANKLLEVAQG